MEARTAERSASRHDTAPPVSPKPRFRRCGAAHCQALWHAYEEHWGRGRDIGEHTDHRYSHACIHSTTWFDWKPADNFTTAELDALIERNTNLLRRFVSGLEPDDARLALSLNPVLPIDAWRLIWRARPADRAVAVLVDLLGVEAATALYAQVCREAQPEAQRVAA